MKIYVNRLSENKEPILSMARIGAANERDKFNFCVYVNPDSKRNGNPYFKFYDSKSYSTAKKVVRLGIKKFEIIKHNDGFTFWDISKNEAKVLDAFLSRKSKSDARCTNWEYTIYHWNNESGFITDSPDEYTDNIEAFLDGYYDNAENLKFASYIPSYQKQIIYADEI